jgi:HK97 family phage prohead protease
MTKWNDRAITTKVTTDNGKLTGHFAVFNSDSHVMTERGRTFVERLAPGSFKPYLSDPNIIAIMGHDEGANLPMGRTGAGTLSLTEDAVGVRFLLDVPSWAQHIREAVDRGDIAGMSFRMGNPAYDWSRRCDQLIGTVRDVGALRHISFVNRPAYPEAYAVARSLDELPVIVDWFGLTKLRLRIAEAEANLSTPKK